jgi:hypothetical protein
MKKPNVKHLPRVAACFAAFSLVMVLGACSTPASNTPSTSSENSTNTPQSTEEVISSRYENFLHGAYTIDNDKLAAFSDEYSGVTTEPTEEEKGKIIDSMLELLPELSYLDVEGLDVDEIGSVYGTVVGLGTVATESNFEVQVPIESVAVTGQTATVDITQLVIIMDGAEANSSESAGEPVNFVLKNNAWLIDPSGLSL